MPSTYRSSRLRGWLVTALSLSYIPVALVGVVAMSVDVIVQLDRLAGRPPNAAEVTFADSVGPWWLVAVFALWVAGWIAFPLWLARVYSNLGALGRTPRHSSAVAVVGALFPPFCFVFAAPIMDEVSNDAKRSRQWAIALAGYWLLTIGMLILGFTAASPASELLADVFSFVWSAGGGAVAVLGLLLIQSSGRSQEGLVRQRQIDAARSGPTAERRLDFGPAEPILTVDVQPQSDSLVIKPTLGNVWQRLRSLAPIVAFGVLVYVLQVMRVQSPLGRILLASVGVCILIYIGTASWLFFRNAALFAGGGYFGRVTAGGRRIAYPSSMLRAIVGREIRVGKNISPRVIFVGPGGRVLFQIVRTPWDPEQLDEFLNRLHVPMDDSEAVVTSQNLATTLGLKLPYASGRWALLGGMTAIVLIVVFAATIISR